VASGKYIDEVRLEYALEANLQAEVASLLKNASPQKIEGNDLGIQKIYGAVIAVFDRMTGPGRAFSSYTVTVPLQKNRSSADKAARNLSGFEFEAVPTSAIHTVKSIKGFITL
jgi:hypothetical protein